MPCSPHLGPDTIPTEAEVKLLLGRHQLPVSDTHPKNWTNKFCKARLEISKEKKKLDRILVALACLWTGNNKRLIFLSVFWHSSFNLRLHVEGHRLSKLNVVCK